MDIINKLSMIFGGAPGPAGAAAPARADARPGRGRTADMMRAGESAVTRFKSITELPGFMAVLTAPRQPFETSEKNRNDIAILETAKKEVMIVVSERAYGGVMFAEMIARLRGEQYQVRGVGIADAGLLSGLYTDVAGGGLPADQDSEILDELNSLVEYAAEQEISDIHIEKRDITAKVRMRRHGQMTDYRDWSPAYAMRFARAVHAKADADSKEQTFSENESQQMSVSLVIGEGQKTQKMKLRVQSSPAYPDGGMDLVFRLLKVGVSKKVRTLDSLGYAPHHMEMLEYMLSSPSGVIIIAGTTGSGKSTTLQVSMANIRAANPGKKLYAVEDPPEYLLEGVTQIPVTRRKNAAGENPFARAMRDVMRMDPDTIMVGEVRDPESAGCLVSMVQSGHKVLTTTHAASGFAIIERLEKMGVDLAIMASNGFLSGLIFQTLVPLLCECKEPLDFDALEQSNPKLVKRIRSVIKPEDPIFVRRKDGCPKCHGLGISGRTVCAEMIIPNRTMLRMIRGGDFNGAWDNWRSYRRELDLTGTNMNGQTALDHAVLKLRLGLLSPFDIEECLGQLTGYQLDDAMFGEDSGSSDGSIL